VDSRSLPNRGFQRSCCEINEQDVKTTQLSFKSPLNFEFFLYLTNNLSKLFYEHPSSLVAQRYLGLSRFEWIRFRPELDEYNKKIMVASIKDPDLFRQQ
jgi:hypothetical protein